MCCLFRGRKGSFSQAATYSGGPAMSQMLDWFWLCMDQIHNNDLCKSYLVLENEWIFFCFFLLSGPPQENMANPKEKTPMCLVNELARFNRIQPQYKLLNERGPAHAKVRRPRLPRGMKWGLYGFPSLLLALPRFLNTCLWIHPQLI